MNSQDPRINPNTAPIFSNMVRQPYARRTVALFFWIGLFVLAVAFISGWQLSGDTTDDIDNQVVVEENLNQMPGNNYKENTVRSGVYNFFYALFAGAEDGLEKSPHNLSNVEYLDNLNLDSPHAEHPIILPHSNKLNSRLHDFETHFNGKILDYEGRVAGDISAIKYDDGEIKSFNFILNQALTPADKDRRYTIPEDEVKVVQDGDIFFIQLNKEQTQALAKILYEEGKL